MERLNFSWILPDQLAGCAGPSGGEDPSFSKEKGISAVVRLIEMREAKVTAGQVAKAGFKDLHEPVPDFHAPFHEQIDRIVQFAKRDLNDRDSRRVMWSPHWQDRDCDLMYSNFIGPYCI